MIVFIVINLTMTSSALNLVSGLNDKKIMIVNVQSFDFPWPMFCHDVHHTGRGPFSTNNNSGLIKWSFLFNGMYGSPCINSEGTIYIIGGYSLYAFNPNGTLKWQIRIEGVGESCPAIDKNGTIYFGTAWGDYTYFYAINPDGTAKWKYYFGGGVEIYSSPAIGSDGTLFFGCGQSIIALNPNGTLRWSYHTDLVVYSSPAIGDDGTVYCGSHDTFLYALYPNNGTVKWRFKTGDWIRVSPSIGDDGTVYCVSTDKYLYALYPNNGTMKWRTDVYAGTSPTIGLDGTIYAGWNALKAVNPVNGSIKWSYPAGYIEGGTPCTSSDGTIFFGTTGGDLITLNPNGTLLWQVHIGECQSAPAIGEDGTIYVGSMNSEGMGYLNAIGAGEPKKIEVLAPRIGRLTIFGLNLCPTLLNKTIVVGSTSVKVKVYQEDELLNVTFKIGDKVYAVDTSPPYEWTMKQRFGDKALEHLTLTVVGYYRGQYSWTETIAMRYFHFL